MNWTIKITEKTIISFVISIAFFFASFYVLKQIDYKLIVYGEHYSEVCIELNMKVPQDQVFYAFYITENTPNKKKGNQLTQIVRNLPEFQTITFTIPDDSLITNLKITIGNNPAKKFVINNLKIKHYDHEIKISGTDFLKVFKNSPDIYHPEVVDQYLYFNTIGANPYFIVNSNSNFQDRYKKIASYSPKTRIPLYLALILSFLLFIILVTKRNNTYKQSNESEKKKGNNLLIVLFCIGLIFPIIDNWINFTESNRQSTYQKADFSFSSESFFSNKTAFSDYFYTLLSNNKWLTGIASFFKVDVLKTSPKPELVTVGKNGWLFSSLSINRWNTPYMFDSLELRIIKTNLENKKKRLNKLGAKLYVFIVPSKATVYNEYLPGYISKPQSTVRIEQVINYLKENSNIRIIDCRDYLDRYKNIVNLYYKKDSHWNSFGAYLGYRCIMLNLKQDYKAFKPHSINSFYVKKFKKSNGEFNLSNAIGFNNGYEIETEILLKNTPLAKEINIDKIKLPESSRLFIRKARLPKAVFFRDSYTSLLIPALVDHFSFSLFIWSNYLDERVVAVTKPNIVIYQLNSVNIDCLLNH